MINKKDQIVKIIDFWHKNIQTTVLFDRDILLSIDRKTKEIVDLIGVRRSGKSSILKLLIQGMKLAEDKFLFINFEDPFFIENNNALIIEEIIDVFIEEYGSKLKYIFFDEIQYLNNWERTIRKIRDNEKYKVYITGSSSKLLSRELATLLTGRHITYEIFPLSFSEFISFNKFEIKKPRDIILNKNKILKYFGQYLKLGGFPEVVLNKNEETLKNYFFDILQKDIIFRYDVRDKNAIESIAVFLTTNSSKIFSIASIKNNFNISYVAANNYINYLKEAFLFFELPIFSYSLKKQSKSFKKIYSIDVGLANAVSFRFSEDKGRILENIVFLHLRRKYKEIYYYRTINNLEIDFVIKSKDKIKNIIQVSWDLYDSKTREREIKSLVVAMDELKLNESLILTYDEEEQIKVGLKTIKIMPIWKWLLHK